MKIIIGERNVLQIEIEALIDTGSSCNVISEKLYNLIPQECRKDRYYKGQVTGVQTELNTKINKSTMLNISIGVLHMKEEFLILKNSTVDLILGYPLMNRGGFEINCRENELRILNFDCSEIDRSKGPERVVMMRYNVSGNQGCNSSINEINIVEALSNDIIINNDSSNLKGIKVELMNSLNNYSDRQWSEFQELLSKFSTVFSEKPGKTSIVECHINLKPGSKPVARFPYPYNCLLYTSDAADD